MDVVDIVADAEEADVILQAVQFGRDRLGPVAGQFGGFQGFAARGRDRRPVRSATPAARRW